MLPDFKTGWSLCRSRKMRPMGYVGYIFTLYKEDDVTLKKEVQAKTSKGIWNKIMKLAEEER